MNSHQRTFIVTISASPINPTSSQLGPRHIWSLEFGLSDPIYNITGTIIWSADSLQIAATSDYTKVRIYDTETGSLQKTIRGFPDGATHLLRWEDGYLYTISGDYVYIPLNLSVWDFDQDRFIYSSSVDVAFDYWRDGRDFLVADASQVTRINLDTGAINEVPEYHNSGVLFISPDKQWIVSRDWSADKNIPVKVFISQLPPLRHLAQLEGVTENIQYIIWSPNNQYFASIGNAKTIRIWGLVN